LREEPFSAKEIPPLAQWIESNATGYALLDDAAQAPYFYSPSPSLLQKKFVPIVSVDLSSLHSIRDAARSISRRTYFLMGEQRFDEAWSSCLTGLRLADATLQEDFLVTQLVAIAFRSIHLSAVRTLVFQEGVPPTLLRGISRAVENLEPMNGMAASANIGERAMFLDCIVQMSRGDATAVFGLPQKMFIPRFAVDWNSLLRSANSWFDEIKVASKKESYAERAAALKAIEQRLAGLSPKSPQRLISSVFSRRVRTQVISDILAGLFLPALSATFVAEDRSNTELQLTRTAVALAVYRSERGSFPKSLNRLCPDFLLTPPKDLYHEKPLQYRRTANGYLLYSTGPNGKDELGDSVNLHTLRGYRVGDDNEEQLREFLRDEIESQDRENDLVSLILADSDDIGIRFPLPEIPLPECPLDLEVPE
jgi:hypothetical protein